MSKGKLVVFEGCDGTGKSTMAEMLYDFCVYNRTAAVLSREPGGTPFGEDCRDLVFSSGQEPVPYAKAMLMFASRFQLDEYVIKPGINSGKRVILDRYTPSTAVYDVKNGVYESFVTYINEQFTKPDVIFLLDRPFASSQIVKTNVLGEMDEEYYEDIRNRYLLLSKNDPKFVKINADQPAVQVLVDVISHLVNNIPSFFEYELR